MNLDDNNVAYTKSRQCDEDSNNRVKSERKQKRENQSCFLSGLLEGVKYSNFSWVFPKLPFYMQW